MIQFADFMKNKNVFSDNELEVLYNTDSFIEALKIIVPEITEDGLRLVLSDQKKFEGYPLNDLNAANRGLHVFRACISYMEAVYLEADDIFLKEGIVKYENYSENGPGFDPKDLAKEIRRHQVNVPKNHSNILANLDGKTSPCAYKFITDDMIFQDIIAGSPYTHELVELAKRKFLENTFMQNLVNTPTDGDNQKNLHLDTYFPCLKFWYFPEEVTTDGAFRFAKGSTELTTEKLEYIYNESIKICNNEYEDWKLKDHREGSLRISEEDLAAMGYDAKYITVPADTLVIANVNGWHGRGHTTRRVERPAIHGSIRINPLETYL